MTLNSLALRLLLSSILWSVFALVTAGFLLSALYQQSVERGFDARLNVYLKILLAAQAEAEDPLRMDAPTLTEPNFDLVLSGWYWQITEPDGEILFASRSLFADQLPKIDAEKFKSNKTGSLSYYTTGPAGNTLRLVARAIDMEGEQRLVISVAGNASDIQNDINQFRQRVFLTLAALGLILAISTFAQVKWGLRPLKSIALGLSAVREGKSEELSGSFPTEVQPLVSELNALIGFNKKVVDRARTHVGNLAHALKTPISVLRNEARDYKTPLSDKVTEQTSAMQQHVNYHLDRARIIARSGVLSAAHPVKPGIDGLVRAMGKIYKDKGIEISVDVPEKLKFSGEKQDLEEALGNIIDNASKWCRKVVAIRAKETKDYLEIIVSDDGPGLIEEEQKKALKRGERLDEQVPGSGLGLSIVRDLVSAYDGTFLMDRADLGGLEVTLRFPKAQS